MTASRPAGPPRRGEHLVVVSPHLDDAVLSVGATCAALVRAGVRVTALTLFAGDPDSQAPAGPSNRHAGHATVGEAARTRRAEDARACALLGVVPRWLAHDDDEAAPRDPAVLARSLAAALVDADRVLVPGAPLEHPDHRLTTDLVLGLTDLGGSVGWYVEQPYAAWQTLRPGRLRSGPAALRSTALTRGAASTTVDVSLWDRVRKVRALGAYRSQLAVLRRMPRVRVLLSDLLSGGERLAWDLTGTHLPSARGRAVLPSRWRHREAARSIDTGPRRRRAPGQG